MSTLTRTNSHSKKPQYKDYVSFLDSYRSGKKDDHHGVVPSDSGVNFSLNSSANNSSSSVFSDVSDGSVKNGFKEHVEGFNNKKSTTIVPSSKAKQTVKTEMFIEIKNPPATQSFPTQVFEVQQRIIDSHEEPTLSVSNAAKIFEPKDQTDSKRISLKSKQNSFNKKGSIGEISRRFENNHINEDSIKPPVKRATSIGEVSKIFEQRNNTLQRPKNFNTVPKPFQPITTTPIVPKINTDIKPTTKPAILSPKPVIVAPQFPKFIPEPPRSYADSVDSALSSLSISPSPPQCASPPPETPLSPPPPPPPLPPANFAPRAVSATVNQQKSSNGYLQNQPVPVQANGPVTPNGTLDKNDPRVKKAVYGALRNMYGAYHDQANDYLATLPKNRVKKNNGLDSIIDSIASQGGLAKLTGRVNPKQEAE